MRGSIFSPDVESKKQDDLEIMEENVNETSNQMHVSSATRVEERL